MNFIRYHLKIKKCNSWLVVQSQKIVLNGLVVHYFTGGQGKPLIIIHGGSEGARAWLSNIIELSRKYTIYVPDLPGFGFSQEMMGKYYIPQMVEFINNFTCALGLQRFYLMGHSLGGGVALQYTLQYPEKILKLVLVSSLCLGKGIAWWIRMFSRPIFFHTIGTVSLSIIQAIKRLSAFIGPWELAGPISKASFQIGSCVASLTEQSIILLSQLPKIMVPTFVVWGARDPIVPFTQAYAAAELIPDCQVKIFNDCGHSVYRQRLLEFCNELTRFLG